MNSGLFVLKYVSLALYELILQDLECPCPDKQGFQGRSGWLAVLNMPLLCMQQAWGKEPEKNSSSCCQLCKAADFSDVRQIWNIKGASPEPADLLLHISFR